MKTIFILFFILIGSLQAEVILNERTNKEVEFWKRSIILAPAIKRGSKYIGIVLPIIKEFYLPEELALLPILESGYECGAESRAGASGCWQFMSATGRDYGLNMTVWSDTRGDIIKSTYAACKYLKKLFTKYNDWSLALAAYNYGQGNLDKALLREKTKDFWKLKTIPKETMDYVPKFYALIKIGAFDKIKDSTLIKVKIKGVQSLRKIAGILRIKINELEELNPAFSKGNTPPGITTIYLSPTWSRAGLCAIGIADC